MKKLWLPVLLALLLVSSAGFAASPKARGSEEFGLGLILGEPTGVNGQFYWGPKSSVSVTAAWSFHDWFFVAADYQIINRLGDSPPEWRWFYGLGGYMATPSNRHGILGGRIPLGIKYRIPNSIVDIWGEVVPAIRLVPDTEPEVQGGVGVTFWIK